MKKSILLLFAFIIYNNNFAQKISTIDTLDVETFTISEYKKKYVKKPTVNVIVLKDKSILKKGSKLIVGNPSNPENINRNIYNGMKSGETTVDFSYVMVNKFSTFSSYLQPVYFSNKDSNTNIIIDEIKLKRSGKIYFIIVNFTKEDGTYVAISKYGHTNDLLGVLKNGEIINPNRGLTRKEAISKLKESKDLLDLEMITKEEYNLIKKELTPIILKR
jgi:hypothetical protein